MQQSQKPEKTTHIAKLPHGRSQNGACVDIVTCPRVSSSQHVKSTPPVKSALSCIRSTQCTAHKPVHQLLLRLAQQPNAGRTTALLLPTLPPRCKPPPQSLQRPGHTAATGPVTWHSHPPPPSLLPPWQCCWARHLVAAATKPEATHGGSRSRQHQVMDPSGWSPSTGVVCCGCRQPVTKAKATHAQQAAGVTSSLEVVCCLHPCQLSGKVPQL